MKKYFPKFILTALAALSIGAVSIFPTQAHSKPTLASIKSKDRAATSIELKVGYLNFAKKNVDIMVKIKNKTTGKTDTQSFGKIKMGTDGDKKITVDQLTPGTKYTFKVKVKRSRGGDYTPYSGTKTTSTKK
ncbi:MAG: hypothetical protein FJZ04_02850 [Candidatus Moranbacteria bacterium]|nr:hypothetical protein [Candidatus Moranbacteria bacterium]